MNVKHFTKANYLLVGFCFWLVFGTIFSEAESALTNQSVQTAINLSGTPKLINQMTPNSTETRSEVVATQADAGWITARGESLPTEAAANAFDNNPNSKWLDFSPDSKRSSWIQYVYPGSETEIVTNYSYHFPLTIGNVG